MFNNAKYEVQNRLVKELAEEFKLDPEVIEKVIRSQWEFLEEVISTTDKDKIFFSLKIKYLGLFGVKNMRFQYTRFYKHLHVPKDKIVKDVDPRFQEPKQQLSMDVQRSE